MAHSWVLRDDRDPVLEDGRESNFKGGLGSPERFLPSPIRISSTGRTFSVCRIPKGGSPGSRFRGRGPGAPATPPWPRAGGTQATWRSNQVRARISANDGWLGEHADLPGRKGARERDQGGRISSCWGQTHLLRAKIHT